VNTLFFRKKRRNIHTHTHTHKREAETFLCNTMSTHKQTCVVVGQDDKEPIANAARFVYTIAHGGDYQKDWKEDDESTTTKKTAKEAEKHAEECSKLPMDCQLIGKLLENNDKLFSDAKAQDVETVFIIAATVAERFEVETERKKAFDMIAEKAMESATSKVESRSRILMQLYNLASDLETKFKLFCRIIEYVKKANMEHVVGTLVEHVEESMEEWKQMNNNNGSERNVYLEIANLLSGMGGKEEKAMEFMLKYLATFENSESALGESSAAAKDAIASFIRLKTSFSCDLLDYKAIQALKSSNGKVFELLEIFLTKDVSDYLAFAKSNGAVLKDLGLNEEETLTKMRLMSLGGIRNGGGEVSYKEICDKLKIDSKECEEWVVRGISSGLVDAKLDQVREVCIITRATQRVFGRDQWSELKNSLSNWSENLQSMKTLLSTSEDISTISAL